MKTANRKYFFGILAVLFLFALLACKMEKIDSETSTVSIDISPIIQQLAVPSSSVAQTSDEGPSKVSSPVDSPAQDIIKTLIITPLSYTTHGRPYGSTEPVTDAVLDDIEKDVPNSLPYIKFIQLYPGVDTIVELEVPSMSGGWQILAMGLSASIEDLTDFTKDENDNAGKYVGFTAQGFTSAADFKAKNPTLTLRRACNQSSPPKGCATFDDDKGAIVTAAVEIQGIKKDGIDISGSSPFPWIVRDSPGSGEITVEEAKARMNAIETDAASSLTVVTTHQLSDNQTAACKDATTDIITNCGGTTQDYTYTY